MSNKSSNQERILNLYGVPTFQSGKAREFEIRKVQKPKRKVRQYIDANFMFFILIGG